MDQHTCPLCGGKLSSLAVGDHDVPHEKWMANFIAQRLTSVVNTYTIYTHSFRLGDDPVILCACERCGYVKAIRMKKEQK